MSLNLKKEPSHAHVMDYVYEEFKVSIVKGETGEYEFTIIDDYVKYVGKSYLKLFESFDMKEYLDDCYEEELIQFHSKDGKYIMEIPFPYSKKSELVALKQIDLNDTEMMEIKIKKLEDKIENLTKKLTKGGSRMYHFTVVGDEHTCSIETDIDIGVFKSYLFDHLRDVFKGCEHVLTDSFIYRLKSAYDYKELSNLLMFEDEDIDKLKYSFWTAGIFEFLRLNSYFIHSMETNNGNYESTFVNHGKTKRYLMINFYHCSNKKMVKLMWPDYSDFVAHKLVECICRKYDIFVAYENVE